MSALPISRKALIALIPGVVDDNPITADTLADKVVTEMCRHSLDKVPLHLQDLGCLTPVTTDMQSVMIPAGNRA